MVITGPLLLAAALSSSVPKSTVETTLCALIRNPSRYDGKIVRFRAAAVTDWHHTTVLVHSGCRQGIELESTDAAPDGQSQALDSAVGTPMDGGFERTVMATFTGRFWMRTGPRNAIFDAKLKFSAQLIEGIKVYPRQ
jgi:hypothetical protein